MAWPATPLLTFVNNSAPACDAPFLNSLQLGVNQLCVGTSSVGMVTLDAAGGNPIAARGDKTPLLVALNAPAGSTRFLVDHNGYAMGKVRTFREEWKRAITATATSPVPLLEEWTLAVTSGTFATQAGTSSYIGNSALITPGTLNTHQCWAGAARGGYFSSFTGMSYVLEWDAALSAVGANNINFEMGCSQSLGNITAGNAGAHIQKNSGAGGNWICITSDGGATNTTDSLVLATAGWHRFRIEVQGAASQYGSARVFFFIDEALVATDITRIPNNMGGGNQNIFPTFGGNVTGAASATMSVGLVHSAFNPFASVAL